MCRIAFYRDIGNFQIFQIVEQVLHLRHIGRQKSEFETFLFEIVVYVPAEGSYSAKPTQYYENLVFFFIRQYGVHASMGCRVDVFPVPKFEDHQGPDEVAVVPPADPVFLYEIS